MSSPFSVFCCSNKWQCDACQTFATTEGADANAGHAIGDDYACQTVASRESILANGGYAVRKSDACFSAGILDECCSILGVYIAIY